MVGPTRFRLQSMAWACLLIAGSANAQPASDESSTITPKIVVQVGHQAKVEAAVWANDARNLITLGHDGSIVVWDIASKNIVNTAQLPVNWRDLGLAECIKLRSIAVNDTDDQLTISFALDLEDAHITARTGQETGRPLLLSTMQGQGCRGIADAASWYSFTYELGAMELSSSGPSDIPAHIERRSFSVLDSRDQDLREVWHELTYPAPPVEPLQKLPPSPNGELRLEHNYDDGKRGDFDRSDEYLQFNQSTCASLEKCRYGVNILSGDGAGEVLASLTGNPKSYFLDADLTADGHKLVRVEGLRNDTEARAEILDLASGHASESYTTLRAYHQVRWLGEDRYALFSNGYKVTDDTDDAMEGFPPVLMVEEECARLQNCSSVPPFSGMEPVDDKGGFLGIFSLENCYRGARPYSFSSSVCPNGREFLPDEIIDTTVVAPTVHPTRLSSVAFTNSGIDAQWRAIENPAFTAGQEITAIKVSPDRRKLALAVRDSPVIENGIEDYLDSEPAIQKDTVWVYEFGQSGQLRNGKRIITFSETLEQGYFGLREVSISSGDGQDTVFIGGLSVGGGIFDLNFTPNGEKILFTKATYQTPDDSKLFTLDSSSELEISYLIERAYLAGQVSNVVEVKHEVRGGQLGDTREFASRRIIAAGNDRAFGLENRALIDIESGKTIATGMHSGRILRAGYISQSDTLWGASEEGVIHFWDARDGRRVLTLYIFPDNRFFAVTPEGRYDTNLGPDTNLVRWVVPDAPWQSLAAQTFMRDYYEPGLYRKVLDCRAARDCGDTFTPLRSIASLNRVLPSVEITDVAPGKNPGEALVRVKVTEGIDMHAANGKTRSGMTGPRLFIDKKLVATASEYSSGRRGSSRRSGPAERFFNFRVPVSTRAGTERVQFSAYAFNDDRIKSETASFDYERPMATPRKRRAFVINIGIDHYESTKFASLSFAGNDARLLADRLGTIEGFEARQVTIGGSLGANGQPIAIGRQTVLDALGLLVSDKGRRQALRRLEKEGIDASGLEAATPDDIVIITYAGHGWADERGDFFLIPSDVRWDFDQNVLQQETAISAEDITNILELVQAGEISVIIDACHSAASVDNGEFKPGPMGDASLGQLAYDKGIRILAAAQADDLALEDSRLQQGLLTYALAKEGITDDGGASDQNRDGDIRLDEWLAYAAERLPQLSEDIGRGNFRGITFLNTNQASSTVRVQQPSLFDFNTLPSQIVLRSNLNASNESN